MAKLHESCEVEPKSLQSHLRQLGPQGTAQFLRQHVGLLRQVSENKAAVSTSYRPIIFDHDDELTVREQSYGKYKRPEDYLDSFKHFVEQQLNQSAALAVVVKRPRDLTRAQLKEVKLLLDGEGYSEANLQSAVRQQSNQDIAASIIGHIRRAALGEALQPFDPRVAQAKDRIYTSHRRQLCSYFTYYHNARTHLSLTKQCPNPRTVDFPDQGRIVALPHVGGLHHEYRRTA